MTETTRDDTPKNGGGVTAVDRALGLLACFRDDDDSLSLAELARRSKLAKSTILRLMVSLIRYGHIRRQADGRYIPGPAGLRMGRLYQVSYRLGDHIYHSMRKLVDRSGESAGIWVRDGNDRVCLYRVDSPRNAHSTVQEGDRMALSGAGGRVLVAFTGAQDAASERIRTEGISITYGEATEDMAALAAPVFGRDQRFIGALSLTGPRHRFVADTISLMVPLVRDTAADITRLAGGEMPAQLTANVTRFPLTGRGGF